MKTALSPPVIEGLFVICGATRCVADDERLSPASVSRIESPATPENVLFEIVGETSTWEDSSWLDTDSSIAIPSVPPVNELPVIVGVSDALSLPERTASVPLNSIPVALFVNVLPEIVGARLRGGATPFVAD
ncbi:MAG TPA: hypothetical protein VLV86_13280, partial [Vicinamibacterales bacterium]|nr:hypothetical protein [Vicinamibacterales bacterium]